MEHNYFKTIEEKKLIIADKNIQKSGLLTVLLNSFGVKFQTTFGRLNVS